VSLAPQRSVSIEHTKRNVFAPETIQMTIISIRGKSPAIDHSCFVAPNATIIGHVCIQAGASVWFNSVLRGDNDQVSIGKGSNIQDGAILHNDPGFPVRVGDHVTVGHQALLHGCTVHDGALIGIQAVVLNGAVIGERSLVAAGSLVTEGAEFPPCSLIVGRPAKVVRALTPDEQVKILKNSQDYSTLAAEYLLTESISA
jgi:carbonic anhydrase/acetyltransferase-like protein (isoleucine patch superfamily)